MTTVTAPEFIFVYGTLRAAIGHSMHSVLSKHGEYMGKGIMSGKLYDISGYPGVLRSSREITLSFT